jgi:hypothetical protein
MGRIAIVVIVLLGALMAFGSFAKHTLFSRVEGVVTFNNQPVADVEIRRRYKWVWGDLNGEDTTRTNARGEFSMEEVKAWVGFFSWWVPHEPLIHQTIEIVHGGKTYLAWQFTKHSYEAGGEVGVQPLQLLCELTREPAPNGPQHNQYFGIAVLKDSPK